MAQPTDQGYAFNLADSEDIAAQLKNDYDIALVRGAGQTEQLQIQADVEYNRIATNATTEYQTSLNNLNGTIYSSDKQYAGVVYSADHQAQHQVEIATIDSNARVASATIQAKAQTDSATIGVQNDLAVARIRSDTDQAINDKQVAVKSAGDVLDFQGRQFTAQANKDAQVIGSQFDLQGRQYSADKQYAGQVYDADRSLDAAKLREQGENTRLTTKLNYAEGKFNLVYPFIQDSLDNVLDGKGTIQTPGLLDDAPFIATSGYFSPGDIQAQVNALYARNDAKMLTSVRQAQGDLAGRGYSSNSPLLDALKVGYLGVNLKASADGARETRFQSAKLNGDATFQGQTLLNEQYNQRQQVALESERNQVQRQVGLVGGLGSLVSGLT